MVLTEQRQMYTARSDNNMQTCLTVLLDKRIDVHGTGIGYM